MMTGREVMSVSCGFWFGVIGLLVAAMVEVFFFFPAVVCGGEWMWMCRFLSAVIFFLLVVAWVVGLWWLWYGWWVLW